MKINKKRKQNIFQKRRLAKALMLLVSFLIVSTIFFFPNSAEAGTISNAFLWALNYLIYAVFTFVSLLVYLAGMLFDWAVVPANFLIVVNNEAVLYGWKIVRDFLNIAFILVLLYSAFCTIFQVEKYHLKKILLMVVLMALLVNFSFPVARFIIDSANVLMYFIINGAFENRLSDSSGISGSISAMSRVTNMIIVPPSKSSDPASDYTVKILFAIVFTFLFAITLLVIAVLLVVRIVVLAVLIIFAPIGFVGAIFPSTSKYADDWWSQLFKQSFFGPIMAFMLYLALTMMEAMNKIGLNNSIEKVVNNSKTPASAYSTVITNGTYMAIPIVILWAGLISAQKMGAAGAASVIGKAKKWGTGFAKWAALKPLKASGIYGGFKQAYEHYSKRGVPILGRRMFGKDQQEEREAKIAGALKYGKEGWKGAKSYIQNKRIGEREEELKKLNTSASDAIKNINNAVSRGDFVEAMANSKYMLEKEMITDLDKLETVLKGAGGDIDFKEKIINKLPKKFTNNIENPDQLERIYGVATAGLKGGDVDKITKVINNKIKEEKNIKILVDYEIDKMKADPYATFKKYFDKMSAEEFAKQRGLNDEAYLSARPDLQHYIYNKSDQFKQKAMADLSDEAIKTWVNKGLV